MSDHEKAFIDTPPEGFLPFGMKTLAMIQLCAKSANVDIDDIGILVGSYSLVSKGTIKTSEDEILQEIAIMDDKVFDDVVGYINRVNSRAASAAVESEDAGKP